MDELFLIMKKLIAEKLEVDESKVTMEASFSKTLGADSMDSYELIYAAEEEFGIKIPDEIAKQFVFVKDAYKYINSQLGSTDRNPQPVPKATCTECGESFVSGEKFCTNCGKPVKTNEKKEKEASPVKTNNGVEKEKKKSKYFSSYGDIWHAAYLGTPEDVKYFLEEKGVYIEERDQYGTTPLHVAARYGKIETVEFLISKGANIHATTTRTGFTALHHAVSCNNADKGIEVAEFLVSKGADVNAKTYEGNTPLDLVNADFYSAVNAKNVDEGYSKIRMMTYFESVGGLSRKAKKSGGCYIATAVYNSYDAPEVVTLRRFRDETLSSTIFGRLFIKLYYKFSPPVAEKLKETKRINMLVRKILDKFVGRLNRKYIN